MAGPRRPRCPSRLPTPRRPRARRWPDLLEPLAIAQPFRMRDALRVRGRPGQRRLARRWDTSPPADLSPLRPPPPSAPRHAGRMARQG
ncbi:hypothetical protein [Kouleothrix sp.]|uniref:hypothetical protein n=1 Tax=Kouleothrix sp. TaxID=2779161 RepID=UPI003918FE61